MTLPLITTLKPNTYTFYEITVLLFINVHFLQKLPLQTEVEQSLPHTGSVLIPKTNKTHSKPCLSTAVFRE